MKKYLTPVCKTVIVRSHRIICDSLKYGKFGAAGADSNVDEEEEQF